MTQKLDEIKSPIAKELIVFSEQFEKAMKSKAPLLDKVMHYIVKRKGKQMRPMFVLLSAGVSGEICNSSYIGASLVELLHTATLVHDDVVDDAYERRGFFSINALWKNKIAVLVGDYLLSKGLILALKNDEFRLLKIVSKAVESMSEGELLQIEKARKLDITEEVYFEIIRSKTASLIAACCAMGAASVGASEVQIEKLEKVGELIGTAFQIKDDLLDFDENDTGKSKNVDLQERKFTLPLIHTLQKATKEEKKKLINIIKNDPKKKENLLFVLQTIGKYKGVEYAQAKMDELIAEAKSIMQPYASDQYGRSFIQLIDFTINRLK